MLWVRVLVEGESGSLTVGGSVRTLAGLRRLSFELAPGVPPKFGLSV